MLEPVYLAIRGADVLILLGAGVTFLFAAAGAAWRLLSSVKSAVREIAAEAQAPLILTTERLTSSNIELVEELRTLRTGFTSLSSDVMELRGWQRGWEAAAGRIRWREEPLTNG